ncbi:MAG: CcdB family protein [Burkholderiales bacterium]|nr:CcdB family protein [Burkholderiales bacterium]
MARFDVYPHPEEAMRATTPFLLDVQNNFIDRVNTRIVVPLRAAAVFGPPMRDLNPQFEIAGVAVVLDSTALAAFPVSGLKKSVGSLIDHQTDILAALDLLFGSF